MAQEKINYEEIREKKIKEYGTEFKDWIWILVKQYKDRTHFLFELLQNAEDEGALHVRLFLEKDRFVIEHDGNPFTKADVVSITKVAKSTKNGPESGSIGKFGIGFKSVYAYTSVPKIYSEDYSFEIKDFIFPYEITNRKIEDNYTRIEIPFDGEEVTADKAFLEIARALNEQISVSTLLFLNNIERLKIDVEGHSKTIEITKEEQFLDKHNNFIDVNILYQKIDRRTGKSVEEKSEDFLVITDCEKEAVKLAFKVEKTGTSKELIPVTNTNIFTFFPTDKESHQSFYIHAPFDTTPARDNIVEDSERNAKFIKNICVMLHGGYCWMRDNGYLSIAGLKATYPIYEYPENTIFREIYNEAVRIIASDEVILPTNKEKVFKKKSEIIIPDNRRIVDIFPDEDMQSIFHSRNIFWIAKEVSTDAYQPFREFLKRQFQFKTYAWPEIIRKLKENQSFLELKERRWFSNFFGAINGVSISNEVRLQDIPLIKLSDGKVISAYDGGTPNVYLNNPEGCEHKIDVSFLEDETIRLFYAHNLRVPNYDIARIVVDEIVPKYADKHRIRFSSENPIRENIQDLKTIKTAMMTDSSFAKRLANSYILTDGKEWFKPSEIYIPNGWGGSKPEYSLVKDILNLRFLATEYSGEVKLSDGRFFASLGCQSTLAKQTISSRQYISYVKKYISGDTASEIEKRIFSKTHYQGLEWDLIFEGFPKVFDTIDKAKSLRIADFLNKVKVDFSMSGEVYAADNKGFTGKSADSMTIYTAMGLFISFIPWVYTKDGVKVSIVSVHQRDLDEEYAKHMPLLMKSLPFKAEDQAVEEILSRVEDEQQKEVLKSLLTNPDKLAEYAKAVKKQQIKELKKKKTPEEILAEFAGSGSNKINSEHPTDAPDPEPISNVEKRAKNLEKEFAASMEHKTTLKMGGLKYTFQDRIDPQEKEFLRQMYGGFCQICNEHIMKHDNTVYFEAINVLKTAALDDKYKESLSLGWNSLCLCPNCAAKYRYGIKDLSEFDSQIDSIEVESGEEDSIYVSIGLQGERMNIRYTPKHFLALQTALKYFKG